MLKSPWMQTHSGRPYFPQAPRSQDILIDDIAHALSMLCRFTGHVRRFYSVAEHSYHVSKLVPREHQLCALLHDAQEAYVNDIGTPLKSGLQDYKRIEEKNWLAIAEKFDLPWEIPACVHEADYLMLHVERNALFGPTPEGYKWAKPPDKPLPDMGPIGWQPRIAKERFYARFVELSSTCTQ